MSLINNEMDVELFLASMVDEGEVIVNAGDLRRLLQGCKKQIAENKKLAHNNELLKCRIDGLKEEVDRLVKERLTIKNINLYA